MFCKIYSAVVRGITAELIEAEVDIKNGLPSFSLVGVSASETREAKERVRVALENTGYVLPPKRITVNLSPADIKKEGTAFDLPVAIAVLTAFGHIPKIKVSDFLMIGELSLDGGIQAVNGVLPIVLTAKEAGIHNVLVPKQNEAEACFVEGIQIWAVSSLSETISMLKDNTKRLQNRKEKQEPLFDAKYDFANVCGQKLAKRGLEIAAAGMHNLLMSGPPGSGKSLLAKCLPSILPPLTKEESMEVSKIYSVVGKLKEKSTWITQPPFQAPHHTITQVALAGGGKKASPGVLSLSHKGVLFLDELPEFKRETIELLRQPLEERCIVVSRQEATYTYPAGGIVIAAMNPCPCGYYPDRTRCSCSKEKVKRYIGKISGPIMDRMDLYVETIPPVFAELQTKKKEESSQAIRERVLFAREQQKKRFGKFNSDMTLEELNVYCALTGHKKEFMEQAFANLQLSARTFHRILRVARTIADLEGSTDIEEAHLAEALCFRMTGV